MTDHWEPLSCRTGGAVTALAAGGPRGAAGLVLAATPLGLFRSRDSGRSWSAITGPGEVTGAEAVAISPRYSQDRTLFAGGPAGLHRSTDGGESWRLVLGGGRVLSLSCCVNDGAGLVLLIGTEGDGVLVSRDGGASWAGANAGLLELTVQALAVSPNFARDGLAFAATPSGLYRTRNGARAWRPVQLEGELSVQCLAVSPNFATSRLVLAGSESAGLLRSDDAGVSWSSPAETPGLGMTAIAFSISLDDRVLIAAAGERGISSSLDSGRSWQVSAAAPGPVLSLAIVEDGSGEALLAGLAERGVARSLDGGASWQLSNQGLQASLVTGLQLSPSFVRDQTLIALDLLSGPLLSTDAGRTWRERHEGLEDLDVTQLCWAPTFAIDQAMLAAASAGLFRLAGEASRWQRLGGLPEGPVDALGVGPSTEEAEGLVLVALQGNIPYVSQSDEGRWQALAALPAGETITSLALSPHYAQDRTLFAAATRAAATGSTERRLWCTDDGGQSWTCSLERTSPTPLLLALGPASDEEGILFVGAGGRLLRSLFHRSKVREGPQWQEIELPGQSSGPAGLAVSPAFQSDRTVFVATWAGLAVSRDGGERFSPWRDGGPPAPIVALALSPAFAQDRLLYAFGLGGCLWRVRDVSP